MKRIALIAGIAAITLTGCVVQSFYPFCTEKSVVDPKPLLGEWKLQQFFDDDVSTNNLKPWVFQENKTLVATDTENAGAEFKYRLFKLDENLFLDAIPSDLDKDSKVSALWLFSVRPTHVVCKVDINGERLRLTLLNHEWMKKNSTLPSLEEDKSLKLYTASPQQWEAFLRENAGNTNAFPAKPSFVLTRAKKTP